MLYADIKYKRTEDRKTRAVRRFEEEKKMFVALHKQKPVLECFSASPDDIAAAEDELSEQVNDLVTIMDTAEVKMAVIKGEKIYSLLGFNSQYLKKAVDAITPEGFWSELRGSALLSKADELIGIAITFHEKMQDLKKAVNIQKQTASLLNKKQSDLQKGNVAPSDIGDNPLFNSIG